MRKEFLAALLLVGACGGDDADANDNQEQSSGGEAASDGRPASDGGRCDTSRPNTEMSEYDTSGDTEPDVRKVFLVTGEGVNRSHTLICRETDLDGDGVKDVVRYYDDEGRPTLEESDRNFDGRIDQHTYFEEGHIARLEIDANGDGRVDHKIFYEHGHPIRAERDVSGRSTPEQWVPDRWEYYDHGRVVRVGSDLDGDGQVDRWDRDGAWQRAQEAERRAEQEREEREAAAADAEAEAAEAEEG